MLNFFHADHCGVVLQNHRDRIQVGHVVDRNSQRRSLSRNQTDCLRFEVAAVRPARRSSLDLSWALETVATLARWRLRWSNSAAARELVARHRPEMSTRGVRTSLSRRVVMFCSDAGGNRPQVGPRPIRQPHDARNQHDQYVALAMIHFVVGGQIFHKRNLRQTRPAIHGLGICLL